jgi:hypothetical protein
MLALALAMLPKPPKAGELLHVNLSARVSDGSMFCHQLRRALACHTSGFVFKQRW